ncbi:MAG: right-handed parallel beta-helix repeat-containing protein [Acidobacteriia bacterium]|nr:right-handed parallel beta-helix repeat-containing protein [Terriglobia bacterium]
MRRERKRLLLFAVAAVIVCSSCGTHQPAQPAGAHQAAAIAADCAVPGSALPTGVTRIYIAVRNGIDGTGRSANDARDGSTATAFDTLLRCYAEGCGPSIPRTENLVACLGPGTFQTMGSYDAYITVPHLTPNGFTINRGWKIHGQGPDVTTVQLSGFHPITDPANPQHLPVGTASNVVFDTISHSAANIEISDLTIDANYPALKQLADASGVLALNLQAIHLWSAQGGNWVHNVNIIHAAGEVGALDEDNEAFIVMLNSALPNSTPTDSRGNVVENVTLGQFGGGDCTAIAIGNSVAEVRNNLVDGYQIGYGGWSLGSASFHDNVARNTTYGFNIDTFDNQGVSIESNRISVSHGYGIVVGGGASYKNLNISGNTFVINDAATTGILFQGGVVHSTVAGNAFEAQVPGGVAIRNFSNGPLATINDLNTYQSNRIDSGLSVLFEAPSLRPLNCAFGNHDEKGNPRGDLPDTTSVPCIP